MDNITVDETFLTGSEGLTSLIDERTLASSPAPVAASTILRESHNTRPRAPLDFGGSFFLNNRSVTHREEEHNESGFDRSSLGLLPSNYLLELESDLLQHGNICFPGTSIDSPAVSQSSINNSQRNQLLDSASSKELTSDSHEFVTTVKKCPQAGTSTREEDRYMPHALFQSVEEVNESRLEDSISAHPDIRKKHTDSLDVDKPQQSSDSGMGQTVFTGSQRSKCSETMSSGLSVQASSSAGEENNLDGKFLQAQNEQEEADHTIHQIELEEEDLEELEETFSDFDSSSDEEKSGKLAHDDDIQKHKLSNHMDVKNSCTNNLTHGANLNAFPSMDGLFKVPLPPAKQPGGPQKTYFGTPISSKEHEASMTFGDSIQFHQSGSVSEWGPSIDFGSSTHAGDIVSFDRDMHAADQGSNSEVLKDSIKLFADYTKNPEKTTVTISNPSEKFEFGEVKDSSKTKPSVINTTDSGDTVCDDILRNVNSFGDFSGEINSDGNGYDLLACHNPFTDLAVELTGVEFGDDDFMMDAETAAAMLTEDEQIFKKDNLAGDEQLFNSTMGSVRGEEQTFMNMTIGTYMATGSGEHGSLTSYNKRPEFGMQVKSPSTVRPGVPILPLDETFSSPNQNRTFQSSAGILEDLTSPRSSVDNTKAYAISEKRSPQQISWNSKSQETSNCNKQSPILNSHSHNIVQNDPVKKSLTNEPSQTVSQPNSLTYCSESSTKKTTPNDGKHLQTFGKGNKQIATFENSRKTENDHTLRQSQPSLIEVKDDSVNATSDEITFSSIYKIIDRSDISLADPGQLILSEYNRKMQQKQETRHSKIKASNILIETERDTHPANATTQIEATSQSSRKESRIPQRKIVKHPTTQTSAVQSNIDLPKPATNRSQIQTDKHPAVETELLLSSDIPKPGITKPQTQMDKLLTVNTGSHPNTNIPIPEIYKSQIQTEKYPTVDTGLCPSTDLFKHGINKPQPQTRKHATLEIGLCPGAVISKPGARKSQMKRDKSSAGLLQSKDIPTPGIQSSISKSDNTPTVEMQHLQTDKDFFKPVNHPSHSKTGQTNINLYMPETRCSESKTKSEKIPSKIDAENASRDFWPITQPDSGHFSTKENSQIVTSSKFDRQQESTMSHKNIPPEKYNNQQRNSMKGSSREHQMTAPLLQAPEMFSSTVLEDFTKDGNEHTNDGNLSLECMTINSHYSVASNLTNVTISHFETSSALPSLLKEKRNELSVAKPFKNTLSPPENLHQLLNATADSTAHYSLSDMSQFHSLINDNTNSLLQSTAVADKFVSSTPLFGAYPPGFQNFTSNVKMEKTILPIITPRVPQNILHVPEIVYLPEVCCVLLSQQTSFTITNLLDRGVKCQLTIREVTFRGQRINNNLCPFELKRQVILSPNSSEIVQVIFRPKDQGEFVVEIEIFSRNITNTQENRTYTLHISAYAEFPHLKISPSNDEIDFGELLWGNTSCRSVRVQNVGRATIPLRFSIIRKESTLCNFSFYPENQTDMSMISLAPRPVAVGSVYSLSIPGRKDGQKFTIETVNIYCHAKELQNNSEKYLEKAERFQAKLYLGVDMPIEDICPLNEMKLQVTVGMYKLHVNQDTLTISATPGKSCQGTIKIINSGNIPMHVDLSLEPQRDHFSLSTHHVVVPCGGNCPVHVTFTPQPTREEQDDNKVNLMLQNQATQHYISVFGKVKTTQTKISVSVVAVNFGGVELGQSQKQKFAFIADNDVDIKVWIKNPESAFKLLNEDGAMVESLEISVMKGQQYTLWIIFSPLEVKGYCADLTLQILYANKYAISINGYGGCSKLLIENVNEAHGDRWLDIGCLSPGTSIVRKITVRNAGLRCCFIKASFYDVSRQEFQPIRATVMPSALVLPPNEATDLLIMINPSQKEADLCNFGRALVALIKLTWGDEITRQQFVSNPGKRSRHLVNNFDIPLSTIQREIVNNELKSMSSPIESYSLLKNAISVIRLGIFGTPAENQSAPKSIVSRAETVASRYLSQHRPVLAPVNPNKPIDGSKDDWTVTPSEIHLTAGGSHVKDFIQIINYSTNELQFSVEHDEGITVMPNKAAVKPKNTTMLVVSGDLGHFSRKDPAGRCGLIKVQCSHHMKCIKVFVQVTPDRLLSSLSPSGDKFFPTSTTTAVSATSISLDNFKRATPRPSSETFADPDGHKPLLSTSIKKVGSMRIQGSDMTIFPTADVGTKRDQTYFFTNIGTYPLTWELAQFAPPYVKHADNTQNLYRVNYDVFKLSPLTGVLQPDETEKVSIEFSPQSKGSYNQAWCIYDTSDGQGSSHRFSVYAKASSEPSFDRGHSEQDNVPQGLSPTHVSTSPRGSYTHSSLSNQITESPTAFREPNTTESSRSLDRGSDGHNFSTADTKRAIKTAHSNSSIQNPTNPLYPGVSWSPVPQSDTETLHHLTGSNKRSLSNQTNSGETNVRQNAMKETEGSLEGFKSSQSQQPNTGGDGNSSRNEKGREPKLTGLQLMRGVIEFPKLHAGESTILKIHLKNLSNEDTQVVIEHEPKPPFMIKHYNFKVGKDKMVMFPVTFKPRHVAEFKDKVVFRETRTGNSFTAMLEAECVDKLAAS